MVRDDAALDDCAQEWPPVEQAIESALSMIDGLTVAELIQKFGDSGMPYQPDDIRAAVTTMADQGRVHWCGKVWRQKRDRAAKGDIAA